MRNLRINRKKGLSRRAAAAVEFAMVAPVLFFSVLGCIEFGRLMITESIIEQSAFEAARNVAVVGATIEEGKTIAQRELDLHGIHGATITITPTDSGVTQKEIDQNTDRVSVTVAIGMEQVLYMGWFADGSDIERTAVIDTERFEY